MSNMYKHVLKVYVTKETKYVLNNNYDNIDLIEVLLIGYKVVFSKCLAIPLYHRTHKQVVYLNKYIF